MLASFPETALAPLVTNHANQPRAGWVLCRSCKLLRKKHPVAPASLWCVTVQNDCPATIFSTATCKIQTGLDRVLVARVTLIVKEWGRAAPPGSRACPGERAHSLSRHAASSPPRPPVQARATAG